MFKKVMVVIDSDANHQVALDKALEFARVDEFELVLLSCDHTQYLVEGYYFDAPEVHKLRAEYIAGRLAQLEEIAEPLRENGLDVSTVAEWAYPNYEGVVEQAEKQGVDLIIHHVERHGAVSRMLLTHDDWQLGRLSKVPLLLVKDTPWKKTISIMAAVDPQHARHKPSGLDHKILNSSLHLAGLMAGEVSVVHAYHPVAFSGEYPREAKQIHEDAFTHLMADFDIPKERQHLIEESPVFALQQAEEDIDPDIVVMGAISRSVITDVFIGSTTEQVIDYLHCDILVLKPDDLS
jgi:universal stress protein E